MQNYQLFKEIIKDVNDKYINDYHTIDIYLEDNESFYDLEKELNEQIINSNHYFDVSLRKLWKFCHCIGVLGFFNETLDKDNFYYKIYNLRLNDSPSMEENEYQKFVKEYFSKPLPIYDKIIRKYDLFEEEYYLDDFDISKGEKNGKRDSKIKIKHENS